MAYLKLTYAEMAEVKEAYERLARFQVGELPETSEFDKWMADWCQRRGYDYTAPSLVSTWCPLRSTRSDDDVRRV